MIASGAPFHDVQGPLSSWARTLNDVEGSAAMDAAIPGMSREEFEADADVWLPQSDPGYRKTLMRLAWELMLDRDEHDLIRDSHFLRLFKRGSLESRRDLFYVRYGLSKPWTLLAAREVLAPARQAREASDGEGEAGWVTTETWDQFVDTYIDPSKGSSSRNKTRGTVVGVLNKLGGLVRKAGYTLPIRGEPDPLAFAWTVAWEMEACGVDEVSEAWALTESAAAMVFAPDEAGGHAALAAGVDKGLFRRADDEGTPSLRYLVEVPAKAPVRRGRVRRQRRS